MGRVWHGQPVGRGFSRARRLRTAFNTLHKQLSLLQCRAVTNAGEKIVVGHELPRQHRGRCGSKTSDDGHQRWLDEHPEKMRQRRETVEHPFGTIKARMGATHFLMKTLPRVASEMALHVLAYNLTRVMNMGIRPLMAAMRA